MKKLLIGIALVSATLLLVAVLRFGFDVQVPGLEPVERLVRELPIPAPLPTAMRPAQPPGSGSQRPGAVHPLPRLVAIVERGGVREALMMGPDHTPRHYRVGDRLPGTDAQIVDIRDGRVSVERTTGLVLLEPTPPASAAEDPDATEGDDGLYASCEGLGDAQAADCYDEVDRRLEELHASCARFEDEDEQFEACMTAADRLQPYPG